MNPSTFFYVFGFLLVVASCFVGDEWISHFFLISAAIDFGVASIHGHLEEKF